MNSEGISWGYLLWYPVAGYLRIPLTTAVKLSLKVFQNENGSDFIFNVSASLVGQGRREWQTLAGILARPQGRPACQGCENGSWGSLPLKALASILTWPCSSTHNYASKSRLVQDMFAGRTSRASQAFFHWNGFLVMFSMEMTYRPLIFCI